jgi:hypothetical protein
MNSVSRETFDEWKFHPVTKRLMTLLEADREAMKEGLIHNSFDDEQEVKGRCRAIAIILDLEYEDLFDAIKPSKKGDAYVQ